MKKSVVNNENVTLGIVRGKSFPTTQIKVICLISLIDKIILAKKESRTKKGGSKYCFSIDQEKILLACNNKVKAGIKYIKVEILPEDLPLGTNSSKKIFKFKLIDDIDFPINVNQLYADFFKKLSPEIRQHMLGSKTLT